ARQVVDGVTDVRGRRVVEFVTDAVTGGGYARGVEVTVELDEEKYLSVGAYLFASVLERFLALYASVNSFTKLVYRTRQSGEVKPTGATRKPDRRGTAPLPASWVPEPVRPAPPPAPRVPGLDQHLFARGYEFDFFQAVRLLEMLADDHRKSAGPPPVEEAVRFKAHLSMSFP